MIINNRKTAGFSLLEVLITLLLVTVGLLGMVAMQGRSIAYTTDSLHRTQAAILANELIEIIRATPSSVVEDENASLYFTGTLPTPAAGQECLELPDSELMDRQIECWGDKVRRLLPGTEDAAVSSQFYVCLTDTPGNCGTGTALEIRLAWRAVGSECLNDNAVDSDICLYRVRTQI
ncbi:MAG: type IV pilus modification protein PilV [Gammaproteobacteria bacterium HGW-Gammaproteobacteria-11]|nr:MAG: type IV pilus modification protein PilV [Gammaproteobacteria bacterium HGW-Gammaproteobacteria-11]